MSDFYRVLLGIHAAARRVDRDHALLGALGVGALAYPHQVESVHRMITGTTCRWLLADEVGLGKTIQAIMVMRALAAQSPRPLNVALVVPDELADQWAEELLSRGHIVPIEAGQEGGVVGNIVLRLARPSLLVTGKRLTAEKIDLLIIDEFTKMQVQVRRDLVVAARIIPNVIVLTATPALHLAATRGELLSLIEPEASIIAQAENRDILDVLAEREAFAIEAFSVQMHDAGKRRDIEEAYGLYRRMIRTARTDYPQALPKRNYQPLRVAPTDGDVGRSRATRQYLEAARQADLELRRDLLLQVAGRSVSSLRDRLSTLPRGTTELRVAWQGISSCIREEPGDAKLDALIDHLRGLHARDPDARVVVVAEDNPTTDYLCDAIEKLADIKVARKRRSVRVAEELEVQVGELKEAIEDFVSSEAKVLVTADAAREGRNLQFSDEIVFFALPWSPPDIQQWIGRIDRLGTKANPQFRRIAITPIVTTGSNEEKILDVLEGTGVFHKSEVFDESEWEAISNAINAAADGRGQNNWSDAVREAKTLGAKYDAWLQATRIAPTPRTSIAERLDAKYRARTYAAPMAPVDGFEWNWYVMRERAAETMLKIAQDEYLELRRRRDGAQRFRTMWYKSAGGVGLVIPDLDPRSSRYRQAFIAKRSAIECPPVTNVVEGDQQPRRLYFFDHGCALHDDSVAAFEKQAPSTDYMTEFVVEYPEGHPILDWVDQRLLVTCAELDLRKAIEFDAETMLEAEGNFRASKAEQDARSRATRLALAQFEADRRWLIGLTPPEILFAVSVESGSEWIAADVAASAVLDPFHGDLKARQMGKRRANLGEAKAQAIRSHASGRLRQLASDGLAKATGAVHAALNRRLFAIHADAENLATVAQAEVKQAQSLDDSLEFNKAAQRGAALGQRLIELVCAARENRLSHLEDAMRAKGELINKRTFLLIPRALAD